jgi:CBS domain-containing membrane protein
VQKTKKSLLIQYLIIIMEIGCSIGFLAFLADKEQIPLLIAPFGATAAMIYGVPNSQMAKIKNMLCGHLFSAAIGIFCYKFFGGSWYSVTLGLSLAVIFMLITNTMHPPGGATAVLCIISRADFSFLLLPLGLGLLVLTFIYYLGLWVQKILQTTEQTKIS